MEYKTILTNANKLKKQSLYNATINDCTKELLYRINSSITSSHEAGLSKCEVKLPINFKIIDANVSNEEIQISIYYNIINELERMSYECKLEFYKKYTLLIISWVVKADSSKLEEMRKKIFSVSNEN